MYRNNVLDRYRQVLEADMMFYDEIAVDVEKNRETINNINVFLSVERSDNTEK
jgi:hypothetical protein